MNESSVALLFLFVELDSESKSHKVKAYPLALSDLPRTYLLEAFCSRRSHAPPESSESGNLKYSTVNKASTLILLPLRRLS